MYLEIDREVGDRLGDGDFAGLRCGHRVICKCPKPILNTKYWKNLQEEPTLRRRRGRRWREGPTWSWTAMHSRAPEPQSSFSQHSKSWLLHLNSSTSALFNGIHRPQFLWKIWHSSLFFKTTVSNNTCKRRSSNSLTGPRWLFYIWFDDSAYLIKDITWRAQVNCAPVCVSRSSSTQPPLVRLRLPHTVRPPPTHHPSGLSPPPPAFLDALLHHC